MDLRCLGLSEMLAAPGNLKPVPARDVGTVLRHKFVLDINISENGGGKHVQKDLWRPRSQLGIADFDVTNGSNASDFATVIGLVRRKHHKASQCGYDQTTHFNNIWELWQNWANHSGLPKISRSNLSSWAEDWQTHETTLTILSSRNVSRTSEQKCNIMETCQDPKYFNMVSWKAARCNSTCTDIPKFLKDVNDVNV